MDYKTNLLNHMRAVQTCLPHFGLKATLDVATFRLTLSGGGRSYDLFPRFVSLTSDGGPCYTGLLRADASGFIGWLPYASKRWPLATDKLRFKAFCAENDLPTPRCWMQPDSSLRGFIVKHRTFAFGRGIRGPFDVYDGAKPKQLLEQEYYDQFVPGTIAKASYWNDKLVWLDMREMPVVIGDGRRSLYDLIIASTVGRDAKKRLQRAAFSELAEYQGFTLDDVVPNGDRVLVDFRYVSPLFRRSTENCNALPAYAGTEVAKQLSEAGRILWAGIPEEIRKGTYWTLDAIIEKDVGRARFLEMNCNPMVHPDAYFAMFEDLCGSSLMQPIAQMHRVAAAPVTGR